MLYPCSQQRRRVENAPQTYIMASYLHAAAFHRFLEHVSERLVTYAHARRAGVSPGGGGVGLTVPAACD